MADLVTEMLKLLPNDKAFEILEMADKSGNTNSSRINMPKSTFYRLTGIMEEVGLIRHERCRVELTPKGYACFKAFKKFRDNFSALNKILNAFSTHTISLPDEFFARLHEIENFKVIASDSLNPLKPQKFLMSHLRHSGEILAVTPVLYPDQSSLFKAFDDFRRVEMIMAKDMTQAFRATIKEHRNVKLYMLDFTPPLSLIVTERSFFMGFFHVHGGYDFTRLFFSSSPSALNFGKDLFEFYRGLSVEIL